MTTFFIVTPIGFEEETEREIIEFWPRLLGADARPHVLPLPEWRRSRGGLEGELEPIAAVQLNFFLKTASRVLWRVARFKARDFPRLHERLEKIDWTPRLGTQKFRLEAASQTSRLGHEKRIMETAVSAWPDRVSEDATQTVMIRFENDECTVSLDTSGEHLHRRGRLIERGPAPLRETLAAFCLRRMIQDEPPETLRELTLSDPCCGSGTFPLEARDLRRGNFARRYAFQDFHGLPKLFRTELLGKNYADPGSPFAAVEGFDIDAKMIESARRNAAVEAPPLKKGEAETTSFNVADLFQSEKPLAKGRTWIVANPPYGERIEGLGPQSWFDAIAARQPERFGLLFPEVATKSLKLGGWRVHSQTRVSNGGIACVWSVYSQNSR